MWPGCNQCGAAVPELEDKYCGGTVCVNKGAGQSMSKHRAPHNPQFKATSKKVTRAMIKARRKKGRR